MLHCIAFNFLIETNGVLKYSRLKDRVLLLYIYFNILQSYNIFIIMYKFCEKIYSLFFFEKEKFKKNVTK